MLWKEILLQKKKQIGLTFLLNQDSLYYHKCVQMKFKQTNVSNTYLPSPQIRPYTNFLLQYPRWCKLLILDLQLTNPGFPWPCHDDRCHRPGEQRKWFWDFLKKLTSMKKITIKNTEGIWITDDLKSGLIKFRY